MARLTPAEITAIAEPLELVYQNMTDELLINIARHLKGGWEDTATWEMKKLGQLGALTEESAKIIAKYTGQTEEEIRQAFLQAASLATADIDPVLAQAAAAGKLVDPGTTVATSPAMQSALRSYVEQATDKLNLTNTTMLTSTQQVYAQTVHTAAVTAQLEQAKAIIETKSAEVITGQETRTKAMRSALNQLNSAGITGFYDRIGRKWQPDAYVNMVIKTTAHNAAITAIRTRQQEYGGGDIFQISSHPGARPLCAPYQGGFYSWSGSGVFTDGAGHTHEYDDINHTSYGEAAGIFGINCGHHPIPMIDGFSFPQEYEELSEEENARIYAESQEQRQLERDIRAAKREEEVCKAAGDESGAKAARQKVQLEQARMRQFIKDTGRVRRYDRESIGGGTPPTMPKVAQPKPATPAPTVSTTPRRASFTPANTTAEAEAYADRFVESYKSKYTGNVDYSGISVDYANGMNKAMTEVLDVYAPKYPLRNIQPFNTREKRFKDTTAEAAYQWGGGDLFYNKKIYKSGKTFAAHLDEYKGLTQQVLPNIDMLIEKNQGDTSMIGRKRLRYLTALKDTGRTNVSPPDAYGSTIHELGHFLDDRMFRSIMKADGFDLGASFDQYSTRISAYATADHQEYVAESFTAFWLGETDRVDPALIQIFRKAQK